MYIRNTNTKHRIILENVIDFMTLCYIIIIGVGSRIISAGASNLWCAAIIVLCLLYKISYNLWNITQYTFFVFLFSYYCLLSLSWSHDIATSQERVKTVVLLCVFSSLLYDYLLTEQKEVRYLHMVCLGGALYSIFIFFSYGLGNYISFLTGGYRIGSAFTSFNNNGVGRIMAIAAISCFSVFLNERKMRYLVFFLLCTIAMFGAGSRTAIGGYAIGLLAVFLLKNSRRRYMYIFGGALTVIILLLISQIPALESVSNRINSLIAGLRGNSGESDYSTLQRMQLNDAAIAQFKETPFFGIGIGASGVLTRQIMGFDSYMHNNYVEMLCCGGIVGTAIYYLQYFIPAKKILQNFQERTDEQTLALVLIIMYLIMHFGTVSYFDKSVYIHMVLIHLLAFYKKKEIIIV